jgi:hypothetical protein
MKLIQQATNSLKHPLVSLGGKQSSLEMRKSWKSEEKRKRVEQFDYSVDLMSILL